VARPCWQQPPGGRATPPSAYHVAERFGARVGDGRPPAPAGEPPTIAARRRIGLTSRYSSRTVAKCWVRLIRAPRHRLEQLEQQAVGGLRHCIVPSAWRRTSMTETPAALAAPRRQARRSRCRWCTVPAAAWWLCEGNRPYPQEHVAGFMTSSAGAPNAPASAMRPRCPWRTDGVGNLVSPLHAG
jgi:hypothetical protein